MNVIPNIDQAPKTHSLQTPVIVQIPLWQVTKLKTKPLLMLTASPRYPFTSIPISN